MTCISSTHRTLLLSTAVALIAFPALVRADYHLERIASGLAQPTFLAQAPGDPANIVYYSTRITAATGTGAGFGTNSMGSIYRYDMNTRFSVPVMNLSYRSMSGDEGLVGFAFSPDFNIPGAPGYQKLYVSSSQAGSTPVDRIEEYLLNGPGGTVIMDQLNHPIVNRLILQDTHVKSDPNHTIDWIGFDPRAASMPVGSPERNYLFISNGDGDIGGAAQNRPEQKPNDVRGKLLRIDVDASHPDAYPTGDNGALTRNYAIPATNPIPLYNAAHPSAPLASVTINYTTAPTSVTYGTSGTLAQEIFATGVRNAFRVSIDRQTGDIWSADVGENAREEINFLKADTYNGSTPPADFGYAQREGTIPTNSGLAVAGSSGATTLQWNLVGGGSITLNSTNPIREGDHSVSNTTDHPATARSAYIGGYVYRGPIAELQGKYFYADYVNSNVFMLSDFDRNMLLADYSGTNFNQDPITHLASLGTRTTVATSSDNSLWNTLIIDPTNPNYKSTLGAQFGLGRIVSFAEDNLGNLYLIDMGGNRGDNSFSQDYPNAGTGEIFMLVPGPAFVPEPASLFLLSLATGTLLLRRHRH